MIIAIIVRTWRVCDCGRLANSDDGGRQVVPRQCEQRRKTDEKKKSWITRSNKKQIKDGQPTENYTLFIFIEFGPGMLDLWQRMNKSDREESKKKMARNIIITSEYRKE